MGRIKEILLFICLLSVLINVGYVAGLAVMSVDIGSEWMKVAIVSPGVPMEIALNRESQRKTPVVVSFRDGERTFSDPALTIGVRFPEKVFVNVLDVVGKRIDNPLVDLFKKRFPFYNIKATEDGNSIFFVHPDGMEFTAEEIMSMILKQAQEIAESAAGQPIKDAVITVPPFFNQAERRAMLSAAKLSGLNVLQLINSNAAVALNYGVFRRRDFNETATNIMFYDMGAGSTVASVVTYQLVKSKETGEVSPQLTVKGVGYDHTLGGFEMQLRLRDHFAKAFNAAKKTQTDIYTNNRAMAKLLKEAGRVKKVLSANADHVAQVESLLDDKDFKLPVSRSEFEELCSDLFKRITIPIETALKSANLDLANIDQVILSGSGTRIPKVQQVLADYTKMELGKSLNTDESAALGAAYQAAHLSKGFKVKSFLIKDANVFPIQVDFQREYETEEKTMSVKTVKRILFGRNNAFPMKKILTFSRHVKDFEFFVNYGDLSFLNDFQLSVLGSLNLSKVLVTGVESALSKHMEAKTEYKGVKVHFRINESGILNMEGIESVFEKEEDESAESRFESALNKLGSTIGRLFTGGSEETTEKPAEEQKAEEIKSEEQKPVNETKKENEEPKLNETKEPEKNATDPKPEVKVTTLKEPLNSDLQFLDVQGVTEDSFKKSLQKLKDLDEGDRARLAKAKIKNSLESFIVETRDKLYAEEYEKAATADEIANIQQKLSETGEWLEYESEEATLEIFKSKLSELKKLCKSLFERVEEHRGRPEALSALKHMINISEIFLASARNVSEDDQIFTEVEIGTLEKLITETKAWQTEHVSEQNSTPLNESPKLTLKAIADKISGLDREVKYLLNKARFSKPIKKKEKPLDPKNTTIKADNATIDSANATVDSGNATIDSANVTSPEQEEVIPIDIPTVDSTIEDLDSTKATEEVTLSPTPSRPDSADEDKHSEL